MIAKKLCGRSRAHCELTEKLAVVAKTNAEVLITGPTGVGKELYARYVHEKSRRAKKPFVAVNCGGLPSELLENEFFGHVNGAFTGAKVRSHGLVNEAEGGTLFLDDVNTFSPVNQVKLLRFLQEKEYRPLGETRVRKANVRIISASNEDLRGAVRNGNFRQDLFFRINVAFFDVPPLRDRPDDIAILIRYYTDYYADKYQLPQIVFTNQAIQCLGSYSWPGNVRELVNCIQRLTLCNYERPIETKDLQLLEWENNDGDQKKILAFNEAKKLIVQEFEKSYLDITLHKTGGNIRKAAELSGKHRRAYFELMRKNDINADKYRRIENKG